MSASANNGYWLGADGNAGVWGGGYIYFEISGSSLTYGDHPEQIEEGYTGRPHHAPRVCLHKGWQAIHSEVFDHALLLMRVFLQNSRFLDKKIDY